jgi:hypothetical protein
MMSTVGSYTRAVVRAVLVVAIGAAAGCASPSDDEAPQPVAGSMAPAPSAAGSAGLPIPGMSVMQPSGAGMSAANAGAGAAAGNPAISGVGGGGAAGVGGASAGVGGAGAGTGGSSGMSPGSAGSGGMFASAGSGAAGTAGAGGMFAPGEDECGAIPTMPAKGTTAGRILGSGTIEYDVDPPNQWLSLRTTMLVPEEPPPSGTIFLWPGLQPLPASMNYQPIGNGVLQPVLTWGPSCAPGAPSGHSNWWISPVYVNVSSRDSSYRGCKGGPVINVDPMHLLDIEMYLDAPKWVQEVFDRNTMKSTDFALDMKGQAQARAFFVIELPGSAKPTEDVIFTKTVLTMASSDPGACEPIARGMTDFASKARVSADGKHCCIDRIVLRARGVMATTMDP